jgi:hypothetical protein
MVEFVRSRCRYGARDCFGEHADPLRGPRAWLSRSRKRSRLTPSSDSVFNGSGLAFPATSVSDPRAPHPGVFAFPHIPRFTGRSAPSLVAIRADSQRFGNVSPSRAHANVVADASVCSRFLSSRSTASSMSARAAIPQRLGHLRSVAADVTGSTGQQHMLRCKPQQHVIEHRAVNGSPFWWRSS